MVEQKTSDSTIELALSVLREHGLVVIAIGALAWQVWLTMGILQDEASRWRIIIDSFRHELSETREARITLIREFSVLMTSYADLQRRGEVLQNKLMERLECKTNANQPNGN